MDEKSIIIRPDSAMNLENFHELRSEVIEAIHNKMPFISEQEIKENWYDFNVLCQEAYRSGEFEDEAHRIDQDSLIKRAYESSPGILWEEQGLEKLVQGREVSYFPDRKKIKTAKVCTDEGVIIPAGTEKIPGALIQTPDDLIIKMAMAGSSILEEDLHNEMNSPDDGKIIKHLKALKDDIGLGYITSHGITIGNERKMNIAGCGAAGLYARENEIAGLVDSDFVNFCWAKALAKRLGVEHHHFYKRVNFSRPAGHHDAYKVIISDEVFNQNPAGEPAIKSFLTSTGLLPKEMVEKVIARELKIQHSIMHSPKGHGIKKLPYFVYAIGGKRISLYDLEEMIKKAIQDNKLHGEIILRQGIQI